MNYASVSIVALIVHFIINSHVLFSKKSKQSIPAIRYYRMFLWAIAAYFVSDILWGIFYESHLTNAAYIDTVFYFLFMAITVFFILIYVVNYLGEMPVIKKVILGAGILYMAFVTTILVINFFHPFVFHFEGGEYKPELGRYLLFGSQIVMLIMLGIYAFGTAMKTIDKGRKFRYMAVTIFCLAMALMTIAQIFNDLLPYYASGLLIGESILRIFVLAAEKDDYIRKLEAANYINNTDPLTGVHSRYAYVEMEERLDELIRDGKMEDFSLIVFDLNDLKFINDHFGHEAGDRYIQAAAKLISDTFVGTGVYRYGGDEFVVVLQGKQFEERHELLKQFEEKVISTHSLSTPVVATGMADFDKESDNTIRAVFVKADECMYAKKKELKTIRPVS